MRISLASSVENYNCLITMVSKKDIKKKQSSFPLSRLTHSSGKIPIFKAEKNETLFIPYVKNGKSEHLLLVGLGDVENIDHEIFRQAAASAYRKLEHYSIANAAVDLSSCRHLIKDPSLLIRSINEGFILSQFHYDELKQKPKNKGVVKNIFLINAPPSKTLSKALEEGKIVAESANFARKLADTPANLMTPTILAQETQKKFRNIKNTKVTVWNKDRIKKEKMGGILGVSLGSPQEPRVIIIQYNGASLSNTKKNRPICFVGKGLTFDSGGVSIKPAKNMDEMKFDMCGSIAVIGSILAMAQLKLKVNVMGIVGASENMTGGGANKPGDVLKARNGKTMEVLNTDAEGRLVLADMLSYACEQKPEFIVDAATLTGAVGVALSNIYAGLFTRNNQLEEQIKKAALSAGEKVWSLPLNDFHVEDIKSKVADVANISSFPGGGSSTAAAFLEHFVDKSIPWAHLDIASIAYNVSNRLPYCRPKSSSGAMIRTFVELAKQYVR